VNEDSKVVVEFVMDTLSEPLLHAFGTLAGLKYPIDDEAAFEKALPRPKDEKDEVVGSLLDQALDPTCFPLASARNALEKFHANAPARIQLGGSITDSTPIIPTPDAVSPERDLPFPWPSKASEEAFFRWWRCRQVCLDELHDCLKGISPHDPLGGIRAAVCEMSYRNCLKKRCGG